MQEARFKAKYTHNRFLPWESIPFVAIAIDGFIDGKDAGNISEAAHDVAHRLAAGMAIIPGVYEIRYNMAGDRQGYYVLGGK